MHPFLAQNTTISSFFFIIQEQQNDNSGSFLFRGYWRHVCFGCNETLACARLHDMLHQKLRIMLFGVATPVPKVRAMMHRVTAP